LLLLHTCQAHVNHYHQEETYGRNGLDGGMIIEVQLVIEATAHQSTKQKTNKSDRCLNGQWDRAKIYSYYIICLTKKKKLVNWRREKKNELQK